MKKIFLTMGVFICTLMTQSLSADIGGYAANDGRYANYDADANGVIDAGVISYGDDPNGGVSGNAEACCPPERPTGECWCKYCCYTPCYYTTKRCVEEQIPCCRRCCRMVPKYCDVQRCRYVPQYYCDKVCHYEPEYYDVQECKTCKKWVCDKCCRFVPKYYWKKVCDNQPVCCPAPAAACCPAPAPAAACCPAPASCCPAGQNMSNYNN